jgi:hypothetical protein
MISRYLFTRKPYNEKKKKPYLRYKILNELTKYEFLSKSKAKNALKEHHYGEISEAFDYLHDKKLVELEYEYSGGRGLPEKFYSITDDGLASIISDESDPEKFWLSIIRVNHNRSYPIDLQTINDLYKIFMSNYLKYASRESFFYLDRLNDIYSDWLQEKIVTDSSIIVQVLEVLINYPNITAVQIISRLTKESISVSKLNGVLEDLTMTSIIYRDIMTMPMDRISQERLLLQHNIIINGYNNLGQKTYKLSLLGILLFLTVLLHRTSNNPESIMYYYNKIAAKYSENDNKILPLIFGKWSLLRNELGYDSLFNFDVILSRNLRSFVTSKSGIIPQYGQGLGCKELYQNVCAIIKSNSSKLKELYEYGISAIEKYEDNKIEYASVNINEISKKRILPLISKLWEISELVNYMDIDIYEKNKKFLKQIGQPVYSTSPIERLCNALTEEITITYYLNLISETKYHAKERKLDILPEWQFNKIKWASPNLAVHFTKILKDDREIMMWFDKWKSDILDFHETVKQMIVEEPERTSQHKIFSPYPDDD